MAHYRKRAAGWRAEVEKAGVRVSESFRTKAEAVAWATAKEAEIAAGKRGEFPRKYVADALTKYSEEESPKKKNLRYEQLMIKKYLRDLPFRDKIISEVTQTDIAGWRDSRLKTVTPATVNREWNLLHNVFQIARREWRWLGDLPFKDVKRPPATPPRFRRVSAEDISAMGDALGYQEDSHVTTKTQQIAVAFMLAIETGMRAGEILSLEWRFVDLDRRVAHLPATKNGDKRDVPLSSRAATLMQKLHGQDKAALFTVSSASMDVLFRRARGEAAKKRPSIHDLHFHDSRHEACTRLAQKFNVLELGRVIGHRDPKSLMIYFNPTAEELASRLD